MIHIHYAVAWVKVSKTGLRYLGGSNLITEIISQNDLIFPMSLTSKDERTLDVSRTLDAEAEVAQRELPSCINFSLGREVDLIFMALVGNS